MFLYLLMRWTSLGQMNFYVKISLCFKLINFFIFRLTQLIRILWLLLFTTTRCSVWCYRLIMMCWLSFHPQNLSVRDMNFVHYLSSFRYPDRTTATLLDQMDQPFGYTFRPANKIMYKNVLNCDWPIFCAEDQFYPEIRDVSSSYLSVCFCVGTDLNLRSHLDPF